MKKFIVVMMICVLGVSGFAQQTTSKNLRTVPATVVTHNLEGATTQGDSLIFP